MVGDGLYYWDFPEGSDQYKWRKEKALRPQANDDSKRIQSLLRLQPDTKPSTVTYNNKKETEKVILLEKEDEDASCLMCMIDEGELEEEDEKGIKHREKKEEKKEKWADDDDEECSYGIRLGISF